MERDITLRRVFRTWWPLAASWIMMGFELPVASAVIARLPNPSVHLAAYGGVVFPLSLVIEAPIIMLLSASTALCRDRDTYARLRRFMIVSALVLGAVHFALAATPLYDLVVDRLLGVPEEIRGPARLGMLIFTPWTPAIAYRRFQQGLLIRFGRSRAVGIGTAVRLGANVATLLAGMAYGGLPGIVVGATAISVGVIAEAIYAGAVARAVVRGPLQLAEVRGAPLTLRAMLSFYVPLAITPLFTMMAHPVMSAALSRMPRALESLAVLPVLNGLVFTLRSLGFAFNEVVVVMLDDAGARRALARFARVLGVSTTALLLIVIVTPLGRFWFTGVSALEGELAVLAGRGLWIAVLFPAFSVIHSYYQGDLVHTHRTRGITEAMMLSLATICAVLVAGVRHGGVTGLYYGLAANLAGYVVQALWLRRRARES
ncbi:MAG: hypothetical protein JW958_03865 [Candidatus Eisenbacteria bacterium]|nr:hypothetical protein [Candidatus Eisenbacteria bacterium]